VRTRFLFYVQDPFPNHNGGQLQFGPDGMLYLGVGDGGSAGDPQNNGQTFRTKLAKLWRIDVDGKGHPTQLVAYGLRNPWRFSFDRATGDLYIGDVGQNAWEEIDYVPRAAVSTLHNFGWSVWEGNTRYSEARSLDPRAPYTPPIAVYPHSAGCSVTGGYVYRGSGAPSLSGRYVYGDYCSGTVWSLRVANGEASDSRVEPFQLPDLTSFGEDAAGALYAVTEDGKLYRVASA
jgi:glucose/arabinose dehydrogenase